MNLIPLLLIVVPIIGSLLGFFSKKYSLFALLSSLITFSFSLLLIKPMLAGEIIDVVYNFSIFHIGVHLKIDVLSYTFMTIVSLVWLLTTIYSISYMKKDQKKPQYYTFLMWTLAAMMGVFISDDLLTLFLFFEIMTIASYVLVVHNQTKAARLGGNYYLFMGVFGGLLILWGIVFLYKFTGHIRIESALIELENLHFLKYFIASLLITGFGVKAGMFPVHIWLPKAHPVAPIPASALLSGLIIKAGAYGILRVVTTLYWPTGHAHLEIFTLQNVGFAVIIIGSITMFLGVVNALLQKNAKKMLAYHSVSQMGYILVGIGIAGYLGTHGTLGFIGALYHIINHALFKSSLFLIIGSIYFTTYKVNLKKLGGLGRRYPVLTFAFIIAAMGISGIPGLNGYVSKNLIHHGLLEAFHAEGNMWLLIAEKIFIITSAGTFCSFLKLGYYIFLREKPKELSSLPDIPKCMQGVTVVFAVLIILLGIFPQVVINTLFGPLYDSYNFNIEIVEHLSFWNQNNLFGTLSYLGMGALFFVIALKRSWFDYHLPKWLTIENSWRNIISYCNSIYQKVKDELVNVKKKGKTMMKLLSDLLIQIDRNPNSNESQLTIKSIDFSKLITASMLIIILLSFILL